MAEVRFYGTLRLNLGVESVEVPLERPTNIKTFLEKTEKVIEKSFLGKLINERNQIIPGSIILVNRINIFHLSKLETEINNTDEIGIFPPGAGG